jgi:LuxR family maltose regulon positive regulatory protein
LHATTEGWAAALRIAASSIASGGEAAGTALSGTSRPIAAYIDDLLAGLPDEAVEFMTRASVIDSLAADLCRTVTGVQASGEMLESLVGRHVLLEPLDADQQWYRFHRLLLDYLRVRLRARYAAELPQLHRRAFTWYAEHELWTDAARHAIAAGDTAQAIAWIARCGMTLVKRGDLLTLLGWQREFPPELMRGQLNVRLAIAWGMALATRADSARVMLEQAEQDARADKTGQELADVLWECQAVRAVVAALSDDSAEALALAEACIERPSADPWNTNVLSNVLRFARWKAGDVEGLYATPWVPYSIEEDRRNVFSSVYRHSLLGLAEIDQARFDLAQRHAQDGMRLAEQHAGAQSGAAALCAPLLAELHYEQGRIDEAEGWLIDRMPAIDAVVMLECVLRSYLVLARIAAARSSIEHAYALLAQAETLGYNRQWDRLVVAVLLERLRLHLGEGRLSEASACAIRVERLAAVNPAPVACARSQIHRDLRLARAELASAQNRGAEACDILEGLLADARSAGNRRLAVQVGSSLALARAASGNTDGALLVLRDVLEIAAESGACRSVLDAGPDMSHLLSRFRASSRCTKTLEPCVERLLSGSRDAGGSAGSGDHAARLAEGLSPRERNILGLIAEGQSNKEVARNLGIAPETVKSHLKNIFVKLSVERRAQAVARARSLGLIEAA